MINKIKRWFKFGKSRLTMQDLVTAIEKASKTSFVKTLRYYRSNIPCTDCKRIYRWQVMTFDHLDRGLKVKGVMELATTGTKGQLLAEIAKCELVCLNCHKLRECARDWQPATEADLRSRIGAGIKL